MKTYRLEGDPHEAEMVECEFGEYVKLEEINDETLLKLPQYAKLANSAKKLERERDEAREVLGRFLGNSPIQCKDDGSNQ